MKHSNISLIKLVVSVIIVIGCNQKNTTAKYHLSNEGVVTVLNGRDQTDSLKYTCDSCKELLKSKKLFDTIISISTLEAKDRLKNKLSFKPMSVSLKIVRRNFVSYASGGVIDSLLFVIAEYKCIGKNGYGVEGDVESHSLIYVVNDEVKDLSGKLKKEPLQLISGGKGVDRQLYLFGDDGSVTIQPTKLSGEIHLIVSTDEHCVEDARLTIYFDDGEKFSINSWNDFNCKSTSYFKLKPSEIETFRNKPIASVVFSEDETIICRVAENDRDYFIQTIGLFRGL
jgi:hypothetical protein